MLQVENLGVSYGDIHAVKEISFEVNPGEIVALIGSNGAGKTSTLRAISGMTGFAGRVRFAGNDLRGTRADRIVANGLAHVPEGRGIFGTLTVMENLRLGAWIRRDASAVALDYERVMNLFPRLRERREQLAGTLSGGEQQMLAVGRALMSRAKMLLLDEPSMGLAPKLVQEIFSIIAEINREGVSILLVEQNAHMALQLANRACLLETGRVALSGDAKSLLADPAIKKAYLGA
ncbi:MAG TPA: ABC transporter ATP-binding protein [Chthoniobacterales bacterium]